MRVGRVTPCAPPFANPRIRRAEDCPPYPFCRQGCQSHYPAFQSALRFARFHASRDNFRDLRGDSRNLGINFCNLCYNFFDLGINFRDLGGNFRKLCINFCKLCYNFRSLRGNFFRLCINFCDRCVNFFDLCVNFCKLCYNFCDRCYNFHSLRDNFFSPCYNFRKLRGGFRAHQSRRIQAIFRRFSPKQAIFAHLPAAMTR